MSLSFQQVQRQLTDHIRDPQAHAGPAGIEDRRLAIYRDLFYNNIEGFLSSGFPVVRKLYSDDGWGRLVRDFMADHRCSTPYFLEISQEFLRYLRHAREPVPGDPPFLAELAHYEWVELALDVAEIDLDAIDANHEGDLLSAVPVLSPLAWNLRYHYPVHLLGPAYQPAQPPPSPTCIVVYRNRGDAVKFLEVNATTSRLVEMLAENRNSSGREVLMQLAAELAYSDPDSLLGFGADFLKQLRQLDIVLGSR